MFVLLPVTSKRSNQLIVKRVNILKFTAMENRTIRKSITINAPKEHVWEAMMQDKYYQEWTAAFSEGSHVETDWELGSKAVFTDKSGNGIVGRVVEKVPYKQLAVEFEGLVHEGREDYESEGARQVKGSRESYLLTEEHGSTRLDTSSEMGEEYYEQMSQAWDRALQKLKHLAEGLTAKTV
jgi:uncharacterized protein YndB with AHSA1/START domain